MTQGGSWNAETEKQNPYHPSLHVVTINGFQFLLSSINCLPSYPIGRRYLPYSSPYPVYMPHPISKWPTRPLSHSLYPGYKSGLRTPVQRQFSLELAYCSNSVSPSNNLYFPLILSHVWKFFSNPCPDHNIFGGPYGDLGVSSPTSSLLLSYRDPLRTVKCCGSNWGTLARLTLWCVPKAPLLTVPQ